MWNGIISGFLTGGCLAARSESLCRTILTSARCINGGQYTIVSRYFLLVFQWLTQSIEQVGPGALLRPPWHAVSCLVCSRVSVCSCQGYSTRVPAHNYHQVSKLSALIPDRRTSASMLRDPTHLTMLTFTAISAGKHAAITLEHLLTPHSRTVDVPPMLRCLYSYNLLRRCFVVQSDIPRSHTRPNSTKTFGKSPIFSVQHRNGLLGRGLNMGSGALGSDRSCQQGYQFVGFSIPDGQSDVASVGNRAA